MDSTALEQRIERLESIEAIKNLQAKYTYLVDENKIDEVAELMTDDIQSEFLPMGKFGSKEELVAVLKGMSGTSVMMRHQVMNPCIEIDGDTATGRWYLFGPFTTKLEDGDQALWLQGQYNNEFRRVDGEWKMSKLSFSFAMRSPYEDGWVKTPMLDR